MKGAFRDLHFGIMSTFVNVKIVRFAVIVNKDRNNQTTMASVSRITKLDNLLTGSILLLMVERRSGNLDHHLNFAICVLNEACRGCFYYTCVENFATANLSEVPVGCNSQQLSLHCTHLDMVEIVSCQPNSACQPRAVEWIFIAAFRTDNINASFKLQTVIDPGKELRNKPLRPSAEWEEMKARLETDSLWLS